MQQLKYSRQRESIKDYLAHTTSHPTADMVYQHIKTIYPKISLGTVYRNLNLLAEIGEIQKLSCGDGYDRFDFNITPHYHLKCIRCHQVVDLFMEPINHINIIANANFEGEVLGHEITFTGICPDCLTKETE